jgi:hypothetical protein
MINMVRRVWAIRWFDQPMLRWLSRIIIFAFAVYLAITVGDNYARIVCIVLAVFYIGISAVSIWTWSVNRRAIDPRNIRSSEE